MCFSPHKQTHGIVAMFSKTSQPGISFYTDETDAEKSPSSNSETESNLRTARDFKCNGTNSQTKTG